MAVAAVEAIKLLKAYFIAMIDLDWLTLDHFVDYPNK